VERKGLAAEHEAGIQGGGAARLAGGPTESDLAVEDGLSRAISRLRMVGRARSNGTGGVRARRREEVYGKLRDEGCCAVLARMRSSQPTKDDIQDTTLIRK
jgi:hypothetical protein